MGLFRRRSPGNATPPARPGPPRRYPASVPVLVDPSGREAVTVDADYCARWDLTCVDEPLATRRFPRGIARIRGNGHLLVSLDDPDADAVVRIRRWSDFADVAQVTVHGHGTGGGAVDLSADGTRIGAAAWGGPLTVVTVADDAPGATAAVDAGPIGELRWSPRGDVLATLCGDEFQAALCLHHVTPDGAVGDRVDLEPGFEEYRGEVGGTVCFSADGSRVYASVPHAESHTLQCHDVASGALVWSRSLDLSLAGSSAGIDEFRSTMTLSYGDRVLLHGNNGGEVLAFDAASGRLAGRRPVLHTTALSWLTASPTEPVFWVAVDAVPQQYPC